jgi:hypothetical protein
MTWRVNCIKAKKKVLCENLLHHSLIIRKGIGQ